MANAAMDEFFKRLPAKLTVYEQKLGKNLEEAIAITETLLPAGEITLQDWIARRYRKLLHCINSAPVQVVSGAFANSREFLKDLPPNEYTDRELDLREALLDALQTGPVSANSLPKDGIWKDVPVVAWVKHRCADDVRVSSEGGLQILHLIAKNEGEAEVIQEEDGEAPTTAPDGGVPRLPSTPAELLRIPSTPAELLNQANEQEEVKEPIEADEVNAFLEGLPKDKFMPKETQLRKAVHAALANCPAKDFVSPDELKEDAGVAKAQHAFLPRYVPLEDWINRRIGQELEFKEDSDEIRLSEAARRVLEKKQGQKEAVPKNPPRQPGLTQRTQFPQPPPQSMPPPQFPPRPVQQPQQPNQLPRGTAGAPAVPGLSKLAASVRKPAGSVAAVPSQSSKPLSKGSCITIIRSLAELPQGKLLPEEIRLREELIKFLTKWKKEHPNAVADFGVLGSQPLIQDLRRVLLPSSIPLRVWIAQRMKNEIITKFSDKGQWQLLLARDDLLGTAVSRQEAVPSQADLDSTEQFFASLPAQGFTAAELKLRKLTMAFVDGWRGTSLPTIAQLCASPGFTLIWSELFRGYTVSLRDWIERRIGGEIETLRRPDGHWSLGRRGVPPADMRAAVTSTPVATVTGGARTRTKKATVASRHEPPAKRPRVSA